MSDTPSKSLLARFVLFVTAPVAALLLIASVLGLPVGLAMSTLYAIALFGGVLWTAFFVGDAEARLLKTGPIVTRGQHALLFVAGVFMLAHCVHRWSRVPTRPYVRRAVPDDDRDGWLPDPMERPFSHRAGCSSIVVGGNRRFGGIRVEYARRFRLTRCRVCACSFLMAEIGGNC
jgi:hypothetical protein